MMSSFLVWGTALCRESSTSPSFSEPCSQAAKRDSQQRFCNGPRPPLLQAIMPSGKLKENWDASDIFQGFKKGGSTGNREGISRSQKALQRLLECRKTISLIGKPQISKENITGHNQSLCRMSCISQVRLESKQSALHYKGPRYPCKTHHRY